MSNLSLTSVVDVNIISSPVALGVQEFNLGMIVGDSDHISTTVRTKLYASVADMVADGFLITDPEAVAATIYFAQSPQPTNVLIGRWDTDTPETLTAALTDCRAKNSDWYACNITGTLTDSQIAEAALVIESFDPPSVLFADSDSATIKTGTAGNLAETLKDSSYKRTVLQYSASANAAVAIMGYAMGANGFDQPSYTLKFKQEVGITPDPLTTGEVVAIESNNCNVYINRGGYKIFENGVTSSGIFFDETIGLDMLAEAIKVNVMNLFTTTAKVPQTDSGVAQLISAIIPACESAVARNFIAPGEWTGPNIGNISTGDTLSAGYVVFASPIASQSQSDREARKAPPISVLVKLAGSIHSSIINVYVNR